MTKVTVPTYMNFSLIALQHSISIADTKATALLAGSIAFLTFMAKEAFLGGSSPDVPACVAAALFGITMVLSGVTVWPRLGDAPSTSTSYWRSAAFTGTEQAFVDRIVAVEFENCVDENVARHLHALGRVCKRKYGALLLALPSGGGAVVAFLIWRLSMP